MYVQQVYRLEEQPAQCTAGTVLDLTVLYGTVP